MSAFPCRCISCGRLHVEPVEWCPEPCHTDLRDSNNRVYVSLHCLDPEVCNWPNGRCVEPSRCKAPHVDRVNA